MRIMVVDDEPLCRANLVSTLREQYPSVQIDEYDDGTPAWEAIQQDNGFDLVIADMSMITMDGLELAERIHGKYPDMQILFQTGESERTLRQMGVQVERCLLKPVFGPELKETIDNLSALPPFEIKPERVQTEEYTIQTSKKAGGFFSRLLQRC